MEYVLKNLGFVCALGANHEDIVKNARNGNTGAMFSGDVMVDGEKVPFGCAPVEKVYDSRMYDLIDCALNQIVVDIELLKQNYALNRVGVIIGSSNTGVSEAQKLLEKSFETEKPVDKSVIENLELGTPARYISGKTGFSGPVFTVSTACSSSLKVFLHMVFVHPFFIFQGVCGIITV